MRTIPRPSIPYSFADLTCARGASKVEGEERRRRVAAIRHVAATYRDRATSPQNYGDMVAKKELLEAADGADELATAIDSGAFDKPPTEQITSAALLSPRSTTKKPETIP